MGAVVSACVSIFSLDGKTRLLSVPLNVGGEINIPELTPGKYRLLVRDAQGVFTIANAILAVRSSKHQAKLVAHMKAAAIDTASWIGPEK
jgi:hypothetical protein